MKTVDDNLWLIVQLGQSKVVEEIALAPHAIQEQVKTTVDVVLHRLTHML